LAPDQDRGDRGRQANGRRGIRAVAVRHRECRETVHVELACEAGHRVSAADLELAVGPGRS